MPSPSDQAADGTNRLDTARNASRGQPARLCRPRATWRNRAQRFFAFRAVRKPRAQSTATTCAAGAYSPRCATWRKLGATFLFSRRAHGRPTTWTSPPSGTFRNDVERFGSDRSPSCCVFRDFCSDSPFHVPHPRPPSAKAAYQTRGTKWNCMERLAANLRMAISARLRKGGTGPLDLVGTASSARRPARLRGLVPQAVDVLHARMQVRSDLNAKGAPPSGPRGPLSAGRGGRVPRAGPPLPGRAAARPASRRNGLASVASTPRRP